MSRSASAGFTLVELVVILMLVGILAVAVMPRFLDTQAFQARGFHDETLALLRYAQKSAISHRRTVCVAFGSDNAMLTIASSAGSATCDADLTGPRGDTPATVAAKTGVAYAATPAGFNFNALGQPSFAATRTIQVSGMTDTITIEAETGYVHE